MSLFSRFIVIAGLTMSLTGGAFSAPLVAGKDYRLLNPPQATESGKKVEVIEFFSYACIHCYNLEPSLDAWIKRKPADVEFKRVPAVFRDSWIPLAKAYYTIEAMGLFDKLHPQIYAAIHNQNARLDDTKVLFDWVAKQGVDRKKFMDTFNSFSIQSRTQRAVNMTRSYGIDGTPALVVDGKYQPTPSVEMNPVTRTYDEKRYYQRYFEILDQLIDLAGKSRGSK